MEPPTEGGPEEPGEPDQDPDGSADQNRSTSKPARKAGRHRRAHRWPHLTVQQVADLAKCAPVFLRVADEIGKHETPLRELFHTLTGVAQQVFDVVSRLIP